MGEILRYLLKFITVNLRSSLFFLYLTSMITVLEQWICHGEISLEVLIACVILNPLKSVKGDDFLISLIGSMHLNFLTSCKKGNLTAPCTHGYMLLISCQL
jgi:hypothetical protein